MIAYSLLSNNVNFVEIGFVIMTWNHIFVRSRANISYKIDFIFEENNLVALDTYVKKMNPRLIVFFGVGR